MHKILATCLILLIGVSGYTVVQGLKSITTQEKQTTLMFTNEIDEQSPWQEGFTKTKSETYVPENFESAYSALVKYLNNKLRENGLPEDAEKRICTKEQLLKLLKENNRVYPQEYVPGAVLSPLGITDFNGHSNAIVYIPNKTLADFDTNNMDMSKKLYDLIYNDIAIYSQKGEEEIALDEMEIMEVACSMKQLPTYMLIFSRKEYISYSLPIINDKVEDNIGIWNWGEPIDLNQDYIYVCKTDRSIIRRDISEIIDISDNPSIKYSEVDKIIWLFFIPDYVQNYSVKSTKESNESDKSLLKSVYWPKVVIFNIKRN